MMRLAPSEFRELSVAVVQDWFPTYGGAERVTEQILNVLPQADVFALVDSLPEDQRAFLNGKPVRTSFIQQLPLGRTRYRYYLPLMPLAIEQFDLSSYDLVVSSSNAFAKGVLTGPRQVHLSYIHSPMRFAWDLQHQYLRQTGLVRGPMSWFVRHQLHKLRVWDARTSAGVDTMVANSNFVRKRIWKVYRRRAEVVFPPVDVEKYEARADKDDFYVTVSRLVPYKRVDLIVEAFAAMPDKRLVVVGDGPEARKVRALAAPNVRVLGFQPDAVVRDLLQRARAFVFAAEEDFGIAPVEAHAAGTPVVAYGRGGALDSVSGLGSPSPTGVFFHEQTAEAIVAAVDRFERAREEFSAQAARTQAERFSVARFRQSFASVLAQALASGSPPPQQPVARSVGIDASGDAPQGQASRVD